MVFSQPGLVWLLLCPSSPIRGRSKAQAFLDGSAGKEPACKAGDLVRCLGQENPLEKEMATHSSILAWEIPWTEKPGGLQSMGS